MNILKQLRTHRRHKPNWLWSEHQHKEHMNKLTHENFINCPTFFIEWDNLHFVKELTQLKDFEEHSIEFYMHIDYQTIERVFAPQGSDCMAIFVNSFGKEFLKTLHSKDMSGKVFIKYCNYVNEHVDGSPSTKFQVTYCIG